MDVTRNLYFVSKYEVEGVLNKATIAECLAYISTKIKLGIDIETSRHPELFLKETPVYRGGLDPYLSRVIMLQIGDLERQYAIDVRDYTNEELKPIMDHIHWNENLVLVGQNLAFEGKHLRHNYGVRLLEVYDTMLAEISLYNGITEGLTLADLSEKYLGIQKKAPELTLFDTYKKRVTLEDSLANNPDYESFIETPYEIELNYEIDKSIRLQFIKLDKEPFTFEQLIYGIEDVILPLLIKKEQDKGHNLLGFHFHNKQNIRLESLYTQVGADMEYNGLPFSAEIWAAKHDINEIKYKERLEILNNYIIKNIPKFMAKTLFGVECLVDWKSPKQVIALFRHLNACPREKSKQTKKLEYSVSSKAMLPTLTNEFKDYYGKDKDLEIIDVDTLKLAYLLLKKTQMNITTYGRDFLKYIHPITGRVHPNYRLHLISARTATTKPNLLAIPGSHRDAFTTEGTNKSLICLDYASQESRVIASRSEDALLINFFNNGHEIFGDDFHSYTSALVHAVRDPSSKLKIVPKEIPGTKDIHPEFTKDMGKKRQDTKSINFGISYGISEIALHKQLGISLNEAEDLIGSYFQTFPDLHDFIERSKKEAIKKGYIIFEPKFNAVFIQRGFEDMLEKEDECKSYFFNDEYKALSTEERVTYKANLYRNKPHIKTWFSEVGTMKSRLGNRGCNLRIQGTSAKQSKVAQINMRKYSINHPELNWQICLLLHDEVLSEAPDEKVDIISEIQGKYMKAAAEYFCPNVKFEASGGGSKHWTH